MNQARSANSTRPGDAFTLVEVIVAVGIVATGLLAVIALAGTAIQSASEIRDQDAALRLHSAVDHLFQDSDQYASIYEAIRSGSPIYLLCYGADKDADLNPDGTPLPSTEDFLAAHQHINVARISDDPALNPEWNASQIVFRAEVFLFDPANGDPVDPSDSAQMPSDPYELQPARLGAIVTLYKLPPGTSEPEDAPTGQKIATFNTVLRP